MKKTGRIFAILSALAAMVATPAFAQEERAVNLSGDVMVVKTTAVEGAEPKVELVQPTSVLPGDLLIFRTNYKNVSDQVVENFVVTNPLPSAVKLAPDAEPDLQVSVDGGESFAVLSNLTVEAEDGTSQPAAASDVTHLRWVIARIESGEGGQITFYAIVR